MIFDIGKIEFLEYSNSKILAFFKIAHFLNFSNWEFLEFFNLEI